MTKTVTAETNPFIVQKYGAMTVVNLRKAAQGKIKNVKGMNKSALVTALADFDQREAERTEREANLDKIAAERATKATKATEKPSKATKAKTQGRTQTKAASSAGSAEKTVKPAYKSTKAPTLRVAKRCQVCGKRPVDRKTQGRDSTMCEPCFEYAGWENTHSDNGHDSEGYGTTDADTEAAWLAEKENCPVCRGNNPANDDVKTKVNGSKPGRKVAKPMAVASKSFDAKAKAFAAIAKAAGWKARVHEVSKTSFQVTATLGIETVSMVWDNGAYQYDLSEHKDTNGRKAKIRNASAARKIVED